MFDKLIDFLIQFLDCFRFFVVIDQYERAVLLRFGKFHRVLEPGFSWIFPFRIDRTLHANITVETATVGPQSLTTKDRREIVLSNVVTYHIENPKTFLLEVEGGHQVIEDSACGTIADFILTKTWDEICGMNIGNELAKRVRRRAAKYGVVVDDVQTRDLTRSRSIRLIQAVNSHSHIGV